MIARRADGSAGDADYGVIGKGYAQFRQPDPRIAAVILAALGDAKTVLNVGAGAGSYEPVDRDVTAVEPSSAMRAQRPVHLPRAIDAVAEAAEARRYPPLSAIGDGLGGAIETIDVPIPLDCRDGFNEAWYGRPEMLLDPAARLACSAWSFVEPEAVARFERDLKRDLDSGAWDTRYGHLRTQPVFDGSLRLVVSRPEKIQR